MDEREINNFEVINDVMKSVYIENDPLRECMIDYDNQTGKIKAMIGEDGAPVRTKYIPLYFGDDWSRKMTYYHFATPIIPKS